MRGERVETQKPSQAVECADEPFTRFKACENPASGAEIARQNALDTDRVHPLPRRRVRPRRIDGSARILDDHDIEARCSRILRRPRDAEIGRKPGEEYARQAPLAKIACEARRRRGRR